SPEVPLSDAGAPELSSASLPVLDSPSPPLLDDSASLAVVLVLVDDSEASCVVPVADVVVAPVVPSPVDVTPGVSMSVSEGVTASSKHAADGNSRRASVVARPRERNCQWNRALMMSPPSVSPPVFRLPADDLSPRYQRSKNDRSRRRGRPGVVARRRILGAPHRKTE